MDEQQIIEPLLVKLREVANTINEILRSSGRLLTQPKREKIDQLGRQINTKIAELE